MPVVKKLQKKHNVKTIAIEGSKDLDVNEDSDAIKALVTTLLTNKAGNGRTVNGLVGQSLACKVMIEGVDQPIEVTVMLKQLQLKDLKILM